MIKSESDTKILVTTGPGITRIGTAVCNDWHVKTAAGEPVPGVQFCQLRVSHWREHGLGHQAAGGQGHTEAGSSQHLVIMDDAAKWASAPCSPFNFPCIINHEKTINYLTKNRQNGNSVWAKALRFFAFLKEIWLILYNFSGQEDRHVSHTEELVNIVCCY